MLFFYHSITMDPLLTLTRSSSLCRRTTVNVFFVRDFIQIIGYQPVWCNFILAYTHTLTREEREKWKVHYKMKMICILNCSLLFFLCVSALLRLPVPFIFMLLYFVSDFIFLPHLPKIRSHNSFPLLLPCILDLGWHRPKNMYQISNN